MASAVCLRICTALGNRDSKLIPDPAKKKSLPARSISIMRKIFEFCEVWFKGISDSALQLGRLEYNHRVIDHVDHYCYGKSPGFLEDQRSRQSQQENRQPRQCLMVNCKKAALPGRRLRKMR